MNVPRLRFGEFSEEWKHTKISDVFSERNERGNPDMELLSVTMNDGLKKRSDIAGKDNSSENKSNYKTVLSGDMVYNSMRMWQGANGVSPWDGIVSPAYTVLYPKKELSLGFMGALFKTYNLISMFRRFSQGLTSDTWNLKYPQIGKMKICMPTLPEQQKIAEFLSTIDEKINNQQNIVASLEAQKKGFMQKIFSQQLRFTDKNGDTFPEWEEKNFTEVARKRNEKYNPVSGINYKCIELENISQTDGKILGYCSSTEQSSVKNVFSSGNILFGKLRPYLKKFAFPQYAGVCSSEIWVFEAKKTANPQFLFFFVQGDAFMNIANISSGTKMPRAEWKNIENALFAFPSLPEQQKIADFLSAYDEKIDAEKQILTHWKTIKKALLQQMFA